MKVVKYNTREHHEILKAFAHSSKVEKKVMMNVAYEINKLSETDYANRDVYPIEIPMEQLIDRTETNYKSIERICLKIARKIIKLEIPYKLKSGKTEIFRSAVAVFPECGISENTFRVEVKTSALPLFSRALEKYRNYNIIDAKFLSHKHSIELYKYLKDKLNKNIFKFDISVEELKSDLGLKTKYKQYTDFRARVLKPAKDDLKNNSVLYFDFKETKTGRKVTDLVISIHENKQKEQAIYRCERIRQYIKSTPADDFKKDFQHFLEEDFCCSKPSKNLMQDVYERELKILKRRNSLSEYQERVQELFIDFLEPPLPI